MQVVCHAVKKRGYYYYYCYVSLQYCCLAMLLGRRAGVIWVNAFIFYIQSFRLNMLGWTQGVCLCVCLSVCLSVCDSSTA